MTKTNTTRMAELIDAPAESAREMRTFEVHGTGNPISDGMREYIGTFQQPPFVWHVFERV